MDPARYHRQIILPELGLEGQERLAKARVLLVGLGGLGSPASLYLAAAGVGTLGLADFDTVDASNLHRQILHDTPSVGRSKLEVARERLSALNPEVHLREHPQGVRAEDLPALFEEYDLILDGSDNFPTRYLVADAAWLAKKPLVYGAVLRFEGQVSVFDPAQGPLCYRCLFPEMPPPEAVPNCAEAGVFGALCGMIGSWQAMEAIKCLAGLGDSLHGRLLVIDALSATTRTVKLKADPHCPLSGETPSITAIEAERYDWQCASETAKEESMDLEIDVQASQNWLQAEQAPYLLDVREPHEAAICQIQGSALIPLQSLGGRWQELPRERPILVYCHHGMRSLHATQFLREHGLEATSMAGGIHAWAEQIEPEMAKY